MPGTRAEAAHDDVRFHRPLAALLTALALCAGHAAPPQVAPLPSREFNALALRGETIVREQQKAPLRFEFHRAQGFTAAQDGRSRKLLSLAWWPEAGGDSHCTLVVEAGERAATIDGLAAEPEAPPWSCDGEPVLRFADVNGDGCADVVALLPYRPPSGERFMQPLVLRCEPAGGFVLDAERSRWLGAPKQRAQGLAKLADAVGLLARYPLPR